MSRAAAIVLGAWAGAILGGATFGSLWAYATAYETGRTPVIAYTLTVVASALFGGIVGGLLVRSRD